MSGYALISAEGELTFGDGEWRDRIGREGPSRVGLMHDVQMSGWVNDCGLVIPDRYPRNVIGGLALICLGATVQPYAGPVVITGWHACRVCPPEELPLGDQESDYLPHLVDDIARALDGRPVSESIRTDAPQWPESIRAIAEVIRDGEVPPIQIITPARSPMGGPN